MINVPRLRRVGNAAADSRESTWIRLEIRERIRACARECRCEIAVSRPRRVALCTTPLRRPRRMVFQRSRSRVAQLDPLAWIIESRSITTPRSMINPAPSNLIRVWPAINRSLHSSIDSLLFDTIFTITGSIGVLEFCYQFTTKDFVECYFSKLGSHSSVCSLDFDYIRS